MGWGWGCSQESFIVITSLGTAKPLYWQKPVYELDPDVANNGFINDDLIVWMREAAFPNFKKLYGFVYRAGKPFTEGLPAGNYSIEINYSILSLLLSDVFMWKRQHRLNRLHLSHRSHLVWRYLPFPTELFSKHVFSALTCASPDFPVQYFRGRKEVVLTTLTWFGGQNHFMPIAYLVTSVLSLLMAVILTVVWWKFGKNGKNMEE